MSFCTENFDLVLIVQEAVGQLLSPLVFQNNITTEDDSQ